VAVPTHVTGVVAVGLIVPPVGPDARVRLNPGSAAANKAAMKAAAISTRQDRAIREENLFVLSNLKWW